MILVGKTKIPLVWSFNGSLTKQAESSDLNYLLKPVFIHLDPERKNEYLVIARFLIWI